MTDLPDPGETVTVAVDGVEKHGVVETVELRKLPTTGPAVIITLEKGDTVTLPSGAYDD